MKKNINLLVLESFVDTLTDPHHENHKALKSIMRQGSIWGLASYAAHNVGKKPKKYKHIKFSKNKPERKVDLRGLHQLAIGTAAGALGSI